MFLKKIFLSFLILLTASNSLADNSPPNAVFLEFHQEAPFSGYLLSKEKVDDFRRMSIEIQKDIEIIDSLNHSNYLITENFNNSQEQLNILLTQNEKLAKRESDSEFNKIIWFAAGVVFTGLAVWGAGQLK